jgi:hypothetical protein
VSLELESWLVNVSCPITARAACPVMKSPADMAAAQRNNPRRHFMRNIDGRVRMRILPFDYSKPGMPVRDTRVRKRHVRALENA